LTHAPHSRRLRDRRTRIARKATAFSQEHREILQVLKTADPAACREFLKKNMEDVWHDIDTGIDEP
jgi:DNA-binding GntR family transcriptional regulator